MPRLFLLAALAVLASGASAQTLNLFAACSEGEADRVCGYNTSNTGPPTVFTPPVRASLNAMAVASGQLATLILVTEDGQFQGADLIVSDIDGSSAETVARIPPGFVPQGKFSLSPDLTRIAYVDNISGNPGAGLRIYDFEADTTGVLLESGVDSGDEPPAWSPDSERLVVTTSTNTGNSAEPLPLAVIAADGSGMAEQLSNPGAGMTDYSPTWSDDGVNIAFIRRQSGQARRTIEFVSAAGDLLSEKARPFVPETGGQLLIDVEWVGSSVAVLSVSGGTQYEIRIGSNPTARPIVSETAIGPGVLYPFRLLEGLSSRGLVVNVTDDRSDRDLADDLCDTDNSMVGEQCSLRAAIANANLSAERDSISFDLSGTGPHTISVPRSLPASNHPLVIDAMTQPGYSGVPLVRLQGVGMSKGLVMAGGNSAVRGLSIGGFMDEGIKIQGESRSRIEACWIGIAPDGSTDIGNGAGVVVDGSSDNVIGSPEAARFNLISHNNGVGIEIKGNGATGNRLLRNVLGMTLAGTSLAANDSAAVRVSGGALKTVIGTAAEGNRIAGTIGIEIRDLGASGGAPDSTVVQGNQLGLTLNGSAPLGEMDLGIVTTRPSGTRGVKGLTIGGAQSGEGNVIVASLGVVVSGERSSGAAIRRNTLGLLADGNRARTDTLGIGILTARANQTEIVGNVVGGYTFGVALASDDNNVTGNTLGLDPTGEEARPNTVGLFIPGSYVSEDGTADVGNRNVVGIESEPNIISGNSLTGIDTGRELDLSSSGVGSGLSPEATRHAVAALRADRPRLGDVSPEAATPWASGAAPAQGAMGANQNIIAFNRVGTNAAGTAQIGNGRADTIEEAGTGINVGNGDGTTVIGNLISGNGAGLQIEPPEGGETLNTRVIGNVIGGSLTLGETIPNQFGGIEIQDASGTRVVAAPLEEGGSDVGNTIIGNGDLGIRVIDGRDTTISGGVFEKNDGPSIRNIVGTDFSRSPDVFSATNTPGTASLRLKPDLDPSQTLNLDVYVSADCAGGHADGTYLLTATTEEGDELIVPIPYDDLPGNGRNGRNGAIGAYLAVTAAVPGSSGFDSTSEFSDCVRITRPEDVASASVASGETGPVLDGAELEVEITETTSGLARHSGGSATLAASVYRALAPQPSGVDGSATSASGVTITPSAVSSDRYWTLRAVGSGETTFLDEVTYDVCLDVEGVRGVVDASQLVVLHRADAGQPWTPYDSSLDGTRLCANGLTDWGDLGIGADALVNPVPNEPAPSQSLPEALAVTLSPNPARGTATASLSLSVAGPVRLSVLDALGREVAVLEDGIRSAGDLEVVFDTGRLTPGIYVVVLEAGGAVATRTLTVVR